MILSRKKWRKNMEKFKGLKNKNIKLLYAKLEILIDG